MACSAIAQASTPVTPTFYARQDYVGLFSQWVSVADTNNDGIPDLIASDEGIILVEFGNGDGTFRAGPVSKISGAYPVVPIDLNGDGKIDLVLVGGADNLATGGFYVSFGNGDGTFQPGTFYPCGTDNGALIGRLSVADYNGDGIPDVVQVGASGVWLFTGKGDGTFNQGVVAVPLEPGGIGLAVADFNGDGKLDLVVAIDYTGPSGNSGDGFYVILGNGNGTFQTPQHFSHPARPGAMAAGVLGSSGYAGIVLADWDGTATTAYFGDGTGGFSAPSYVNLEAENSSLAIADINNDGIPDLVAANGEAYVAFGTTSNTFAKEQALPIQAGEGVYNLAVADLRKDGRLDIVTDSQFGVSVLLNTGTGRFEDGLFTTLTAAAGCGVTGDFNGDGREDIAVNTSQGISILLGTGKPAALFTVGQALALPGAGCLTQARDLNGDGILDLVITSATQVEAYLGKGDGTFTLKSSTPILNAPEYVVLADFNRDGKLDFATNGNQIALGNGDGTFQTPTPFVSNPPKGRFNNITVGDINNDGWPDIVMTNFDAPYYDLYVGLNNHLGFFKQIPQTFGADSSGAVLTDLNGDGILDLVATNQVYLGDGHGDFTFVVDLGFVGSGTFNMVADVNGDGIPDIGVLGAGTVQVYLGLGNATYATPFYLGTGPSPGMIFPADLHGQRASKGLPDLVAPDETGGVEVLLNLTK